MGCNQNIYLKKLAYALSKAELISQILIFLVSSSHETIPSTNLSFLQYHVIISIMK